MLGRVAGVWQRVDIVSQRLACLAGCGEYGRGGGGETRAPHPGANFHGLSVPTPRRIHPCSARPRPSPSRVVLWGFEDLESRDTGRYSLKPSCREGAVVLESATLWATPP